MSLATGADRGRSTDTLMKSFLGLPLEKPTSWPFDQDDRRTTSPRDHEQP